MNVGTKSLLFGVHQFLWHPWTVGRAWRHIYGRWPTVDEWLCILVHDWGYWGCENMDGEQGKRHPEAGARIACWLVSRWNRWVRGYSRASANLSANHAYYRTLYHSSHYAKMFGAPPSPLYLPDKASILFEPRWWYLLRAKLSGEVHEYIGNSPLMKYSYTAQTPGRWYNWYRSNVKQKLEQYEKTHPCGLPVTRCYSR